MTLSLNDFHDDLQKCYQSMVDINGSSKFGYRAPCFSLDRKRLDIVKKNGFLYDASRINFSDHPLYGSVDMNGFEKISECVFKDESFF